MNNLFIIYSNLGIGGIPKKIIDITNQCTTMFPDADIHILLQKDVDFSLHANITNHRSTIDYYQRRDQIKSPYLFPLYILKTILDRNPSVILAFISSYALPVLFCKYLLFWRRLKVVIAEDHLTSTMIHTMKLPWLQKLGIRLLYPKADMILVPTRAIKYDLVHSFSVPEKNIFVIPNWTTSRQTLHQTIRGIDIIYVGRFGKTKNLPDIISIASRVQKFYTFLHVVLLGDGPEKAMLRHLIYQHKLKEFIRLLPPVKDPAAYLEQSKLFLYTSGNTEGMPIAILEAMAHGCVVVSMPFQGITEIIHHQETGFIAQTQKEMEEIVKILLKNPSLRKIIAKNAHAYVSKHHSQKLCRHYVQSIA